jgi:hypothetical protein
MTVGDTIGVAGLAVSLFAAIWAVFNQRIALATVVTAATVFLSISAFSVEGGIAYYKRRQITQDMIKLISDKRYFWTFDDLFKEEVGLRPGWDSVIRSELQDILYELVQQGLIVDPIVAWLYGSPPDTHDVRVYCMHCKPSGSQQ